MINFPVLNHVSVDDYGLFPGTDARAGLVADLTSKLSVVVGANGLGKSTLLSIAFRLLTGPWDIPGASNTGELGSARLDLKRLPTAQAREFGHRVSDSARDSVARAEFTLGDVNFVVSRSLFDLSLREWSINEVVQSGNEADFQRIIAEHCGVWSFADWILVLRYVTFYMDDRQVLFWDRSAQKQLLRSLFLSPSEAKQWVEMERNVLQSDSRYRNFRNVLNSETARLTVQIDPSSETHSELREELSALLLSEDNDLPSQENALRELADLEESRANKNLERLRARQKLDELSRAYEHAKLINLSAKFPDNATSALFIWNQILADTRCMLCGSEVPEFRKEVEERIEAHRCSVCNSEVDAAEPSESPEAIELSRERSSRTWDEFASQQALLAGLEHDLESIESELEKFRAAAATREVARTVREQRIGALRAQLPADAEGYFKDRSNLASMKARMEEMSDELRVSATEFEEYVSQKSQSILQSADLIKASFDRYASLFLLGDGELSWTPREEQLGQSSYKIKFPAYELQLGKSDTGSVSIRSGAGDVSESQKEFIDLAFRMALIETAGNQQGASLIIDTPESSLDSVFSDRAATVLADYATSADNRLVVASNLTDGRLVPMLVRAVKAADAPWQLINLFEIARPTVAIRELGEAYKNAYQRLLTNIDEG